VLNEPKSIPQVMTELKELTISYAKQETVDPVKDLGRFLKFGVPGSLLLAFGVGMLGLAFLRYLQTETGTALTGSLSWVPYLACLVLLTAIAGLCVVRIVREPGR
jgi:hypothetical protein